MDASVAVRDLHASFEQGLEQSFEWKTRVKKSSEPVWMMDGIRNMIEDRRAIFRTDGERSDRWKALKRKVSATVKKRKSGYNKHLLEKFDNDPDPRIFYHHVNGLLSGENKPNLS